MSIERLQYPISIILTIFFCVYASFVYGSCQKPNTSEPELDFNTDFSACHASHVGTVSQEPELFIFVSNSMPEESLRQWAAQADKAGGVLVLRGFIDDSLKTTLERGLELFAKEGGQGFSIDPERFEQLGIDKVPAVAIVAPQASQFEAEPQKPLFEVVYGDVPLDEALSVIVARGSDNIRKAVKVFLQRYREQ